MATEQTSKTKEQESHEAFEAWKKRKDERIRSTKQLYTYNLEKPKRGIWCPARSVKYAYPSDPRKSSPDKSRSLSHSPRHSTSHGSRARSRDASVSDSYSAFSSEEEEEEEEEEEGSHTGTHSGASSPHLHLTHDDDRTGKEGKLKTVRLCCQTLEYWCTCSDD